MAGAGANMQGQITGALERQNADQFNRESMAAGQELGSFGRVTDQSSEQRQKGNLFNDILSAGSVVGSFFGGNSTDFNAPVQGVQGPQLQNYPQFSDTNLTQPSMGGGQQGYGGWGQAPWNPQQFQQNVQNLGYGR